MPNKQESRSVASVGIRCPLIVAPSCPVFDLLASFQKGHSHLALVSDDPHAALKW